MNAFNSLNTQNRFTIHFIDPCYYNWNNSGHSQDIHAALSKLETDDRFLNLIGTAKWYIHEYYENYDVFNTNRSLSKHIYQFGITPEIDLTIPNYNNHFILFQDVVTYDRELREASKRDSETGQGLSKETQNRITSMGLADVNKFCGVCSKSSFPMMGDLFRDTWTKVRYFWTINHITNAFVIALLKMMNDEHLHIDMGGRSWEQILGDDLYRTPHTPLTQYDAMNYGICWPEGVSALQL